MKEVTQRAFGFAAAAALLAGAALMSATTKHDWYWVPDPEPAEAAVEACGARPIIRATQACAGAQSESLQWTCVDAYTGSMARPCRVER